MQRAFERGPGLAFPGSLDPQLGGDEQFIAGDAAGGDRASDRFLVLVGGGGVEHPVAGGEGVADRPFALGRVGDLEDAEAEDRHLDAVVEGDRTHEIVLLVVELFPVHSCGCVGGRPCRTAHCQYLS